MKNERILNNLGQVNEEFIEEAAPVKNANSKRSWVKLGAMVACLCLVIGVSIYTLDFEHPGNNDFEYPGNSDFNHPGNNDLDVTHSDNDDISVDTEEVAVGFVMDNVAYFPISFNDYIRFGLIPEDATGLTNENKYQISKDDLGEVMGTVELSGDDGLVEATVYHFASFPDYDAICIVEVSPGNYHFYVSDGLQLSDEIGQNTQLILDAYDMPESITKITVQTGDWETVLSITDAETIAAICDIMNGKENIGLEAHEKLFAQLWYDTYGNEDVYYDEEDGSMHYKSVETEPSDSVSKKDEEGNTSVETSEDSGFTELYDKAHALWSEGERVVWFTTDRGFEFYMIYKPSIATFSLYGYYCLSDSEVAQMNELLKID